MSNIIFFNSGGGGGGNGIQTITGNDLTPVGPNGGGNLNLIGDFGMEVTNIAPNTLALTYGTPFVLQTTDDNPHSFAPAFNMLVNTSATLTGTLIGSRADYSASFSAFYLLSAYFNAGFGSVQLVDDPLISPIQNAPGTSFDIVASGPNVEFSVTGEFGVTWNWILIVNPLVQNI